MELKMDSKSDAIMDAIEQLKGQMMEYMLQSGEEPEAEAGASPEAEEPEMPPEPEEPAEDLEMEMPEPPKSSVLGRYEGSAPPKKAPPASEPEMPFPPKRGRGRPPRK